METFTTSSQLPIGKKIARVRELLGYTQADLAALMSVTQQAISKMEASNKVDDLTIRRVANCLGIKKEAIKNFSNDLLIELLKNKGYTSKNTKAANSTIEAAREQKIDLSEKIIELYERLYRSEVLVLRLSQTRDTAVSEL